MKDLREMTNEEVLELLETAITGHEERKANKKEALLEKGYKTINNSDEGQSLYCSVMNATEKMLLDKSIKEFLYKDDIWDDVCHLYVWADDSDKANLQTKKFLLSYGIRFSGNELIDILDEGDYVLDSLPF